MNKNYLYTDEGKILTDKLIVKHKLTIKKIREWTDNITILDCSLDDEINIKEVPKGLIVSYFHQGNVVDFISSYDDNIMSISDLMISSSYMKRWFSRGAMNFFNTIIESELFDNKFFITSDRFSLGGTSKRFYNVREVLENGIIETHGNHSEFLTINKAEKKLNQLRSVKS